MTSIKNWLPIYAMAGLTLAVAPAVHSEEGGSEPEAYELLEPAGPEFWEQLSVEQQLAELERAGRETVRRSAYVLVDLAPMAEAGTEESIRVSLRPFQDLVIEVDLVRENPRLRKHFNWHTSRGSQSFVTISASSVKAPFQRGPQDPYRYVKILVRHDGSSIVSREVPGAPNVLCIEDVAFNLHEPDEMNNSPGTNP
jgi:hypothetical protein